MQYKIKELTPGLREELRLGFGFLSKQFDELDIETTRLTRISCSHAGSHGGQGNLYYCDMKVGDCVYKSVQIYETEMEPCDLSPIDEFKHYIKKQLDIPTDMC